MNNWKDLPKGPVITAEELENLKSLVLTNPEEQEMLRRLIQTYEAHKKTLSEYEVYCKSNGRGHFALTPYLHQGGYTEELPSIGSMVVTDFEITGWLSRIINVTMGTVVGHTPDNDIVVRIVYAKVVTDEELEYWKALPSKPISLQQYHQSPEYLLYTGPRKEPFGVLTQISQRWWSLEEMETTYGKERVRIEYPCMEEVK
jgi:hypothetical protein